MGPLLRCCTEVRIAIELAFGMISEVRPGVDVLDGGPRTCLKERGCFGIFWHLRPHWFERQTDVLFADLCVKVDNISVRTICCWNLCFIGFPKMYSRSRSMLGFDSNCRATDDAIIMTYVNTQHLVTKYTIMARRQR